MSSAATDRRCISGPGLIDINTGFGVSFPQGAIWFTGTIYAGGTPVRLVRGEDFGMSPDNPDNLDAITRAWKAACHA